MMTFTAYALKNIRIDGDNNGLFAQVPDQSGEWMTVRCVESKKSVHASHCSCHTFAKKQSCGHVEIVQAYYNKLYKVTPVVETPVAVETPKVAKVRKPRNGLVRKVRNGGLVKVAQPSTETKVVEQTTTQEVAPKAAVLFTEKANMPRRYATEMIEAQENKAAIVAQMREVTDLSKKGNFGSKAFSLMR